MLKRNPSGDSGDGGVIDVAVTASELRDADVAIVVDVLRATSTIAQALDAGYRRVLCCGTVDKARELAGPGRVLAGEQERVQVPGFDLGNSPAALHGRPALAEELVLATTNGTPAIVAATKAAGRVLLASLLNLDTVVAAVPPGCSVVVVCSGTDGRLALEDVYVAGRIARRLPGPRTDAAIVAERMARAFSSPLEPLVASADGAALRATGQEHDIAWCARESVLQVVPEASGEEEGAVVATAAEARPKRRRFRASRRVRASEPA